MNIQLAKRLIIDHVLKINEEWVLKAIFRLIGIDEKAAEDEFIKKYEAKLKPMTKEELIQHALEAEEDYKNGRYMDIKAYTEMVEKQEK